jgi:hypothetical protein
VQLAEAARQHGLVTVRRSSRWHTKPGLEPVAAHGLDTLVAYAM